MLALRCECVHALIFLWENRSRRVARAGCALVSRHKPLHGRARLAGPLDIKPSTHGDACAEPSPLPLGQVPLGLRRRAGEGLRSAPAGGTQQQPTPAGGVPASGPGWPDAGWVLGTRQEPPQRCQRGGQEGLCATLRPLAGSSCQPAGPSHCVAGRERLWLEQLIPFISRSIQCAFLLSSLFCKVKTEDAAVHIK